jgi:hypothetical protein
MSSQTPLSTAILRTISYYDVHDYPLTSVEVWRWLFPDPYLERQDWSQQHVDQELATLVSAGIIGRRGDYVMLAGREALVDIRTERAERSLRLWRRAASTARYIELVPGIRMVAVVNTLAIDNVKPTSDIDLLIVTTPGLMWMTRALVTGIVAMLGYRRHGQNIAGRVCLSFYLSTAALDLAPLKREEQDTHFAMWATQAVPLLNDGTYEKFVAANSWITDQLPHAWQWNWRAKLLEPNASLRAIKQFYEVFFATPIGHWFVAFARDRQLKKMDKNTNSKAKDGTTDVIISEDVLKFHEADRRLEYNAAWRERMTKLGLSV